MTLGRNATQRAGDCSESIALHGALHAQFAPLVFSPIGSQTGNRDARGFFLAFVLKVPCSEIILPVPKRHLVEHYGDSCLHVYEAIHICVGPLSLGFNPYDTQASQQKSFSDYHWDNR